MCLFHGVPISRRRALGSFFCGGGFIPQPLERRESSVDLVGRKSFWIEVVAKPCPAKNVWILLSERPIYRHSAGTVLPVAAVDPFSAGERASYYAPAGVLSRSSGILFNVKPNGDWLAVRYNDTENNMALWEFHYGNCKPDQIQGPIQTLYARSKCVARVENEGERY